MLNGWGHVWLCRWGVVIMWVGPFMFVYVVMMWVGPSMFVFGWRFQGSRFVASCESIS
jgi:hypothetical protein